VRSHYPLHPYFQEQADRLGIMQWSEIPVYSVKTQFLAQDIVRKLAARELESNILTNGNHPSVIVWSMGNELSARPGPVQGYYIRRAATAAKRLDPTRPVGLAVAGYPSAGCQSEYAPLDVIGINEYFGWYPGPGGQIADRTALPEYLDSVRACYPRKAIVITEFGAEANRDGPVEEKGTYAYQQDFVNYHLGVYATKPWLSGAIYWTLQEFRVRPNWDGGNPRPSSPLHQKAVIAFDGTKKPAFFDLQRIYGRRARSARAADAPRARYHRPAHGQSDDEALPRRARALELAGDAPPASPGPRARGPLRRRPGPLPFAVDERELRHALAASGAVVELQIGGSSTPAVLKDSQIHPVRGETMHVDFLRVDLRQSISAVVALEFLGADEAPGVREGGVLEYVTREVNIEALPTDIPEAIQVDVSRCRSTTRCCSPPSRRRTA
jgi:hypothetical protein